MTNMETSMSTLKNDGDKVDGYDWIVEYLLLIAYSFFSKTISRDAGSVQLQSQSDPL